ncbi:uncharacterized protein BKCO1_6000159 [Diplodia corticola]|uniref:JmjC domain-containing protein n=1 Tax=Diplodia corticola TaxID=236234 RepID=A0A1J9RB48_9PEZI|nr:uncharacterized protein BKCO1_6000159 [Diplodia corticola]OJD37697.1 hypothetical protein BKCO1_6000159 [Diplodia corticola]
MTKIASRLPKWPPVQAIQGVRNNRLLGFTNSDQPRRISWERFQSVSAQYRWFKAVNSKADQHTLDIASLRPFSKTVVPLEYTGPDPTNSSAKVFRRFDAPLQVFLDYLEKPPQGIRIYLAQCSLSTLPKAMQAALPMPQFLTDHAATKNANGKPTVCDIYDSSLWMGLPPTYTPLHRDPNDNCFFQLAGKKTIRLLPPNTGRDLFERVKERIGEGEGDLSGRIRGEEMMTGREKDELEKEVWDTAYDPESGGVEARLVRGDGLYIPKGWWHSVKGHGETFTASVSILSYMSGAMETPIRTDHAHR